MTIIDAWIQHPGRLPGAVGELGLDERTQRLFLSDNAQRVFRLT